MLIKKKKKRILLDVETNGLLDTCTKIWCIVTKDVDTGQVRKFRPKSPSSGHVDFIDEFKEFIKDVDIIIGHNIIGFDIRAIAKLLGISIPVENTIDTLVLSRLFRPVSPFADTVITTDNRIGGHSLEAWGRRLGFAKGEYNDWTKFTEEMLEYCARDIDLTEKIYHYLIDKESQGFSEYSIRLEHTVADLLAEQEANGFYLDQNRAKELASATEQLLTEMRESFDELFPPIPKLINTYKVKYNKDGSMNKVSQRILNEYGDLAKKVANDTYDLYKMEEFNPQSSSQIGERLLKLGWKPKKFTPSGKPKTDKETLHDAIEELSQFSEIKALSQYNIVADRNQKAKKWLELVKSDGRVHGKINPIGAGTHRCSHYDDNMANIARVVPGKLPLQEFIQLYGNPAKYEQFEKICDDKVFLHANEKEVEFIWTGLKGAYGWESRSCWIAQPGWGLVGADASGIQLRGLAHYMNDPEYTKYLLTGDIHEFNRQAAGIINRNRAKTFIYAFLLGAGNEKVGLIVGVTPEEYDDLQAWYGNKETKRLVGQLRFKGRKADAKTVFTIIKGAKIKKQFLEAIPSLRRLKEEDIPKAAKDGCMLGLDGRKIWIPNEHLALAMYLQGFEAVIMKLAMQFFNRELKALQIPYRQCCFCHDEFQIESPKEFCKKVGETVVWSIQQAGIELGSNCPLDGAYRVGSSWATTH